MNVTQECLPEIKESSSGYSEETITTAKKHAEWMPATQGTRKGHSIFHENAVMDAIWGLSHRIYALKECCIRYFFSSLCVGTMKYKEVALFRSISRMTVEGLTNHGLVPNIQSDGPTDSISEVIGINKTNVSSNVWSDSEAVIQITGPETKVAGPRPVLGLMLAKITGNKI
ncbi:hypothetical protein EDD18DRAFT_1098798 [Armillaria luteobubalina]|uniref:Uncharacterized protein n=1 Tax=Armillaria luteobubalina TaxID=153913 RepID=A0AA39QNA1_9AGAR|nr:hypothetical protein EDD18DRAFT_1098798 [Armillaria luteobubalina]